jgi:hypothetical protein
MSTYFKPSQARVSPSSSNMKEKETTNLRQGLLAARLEWCLRQRMRATERDDKEGWLAEEEGLRDSLLNRDRADLIRLCYPSQVERYRLGFHDGQALLRLPPNSSLRREMVDAMSPSLSTPGRGSTAADRSHANL